MTDYRISDAQLTEALRAHLPASAPADLDERIRRQVAGTRQARPWLGGLGDRLQPAWSAERPRWLLVAAALALLLLAIVALGIGQQLLRPPTPDQLLERSWQAMANPPAFTMDLATTSGRQYHLSAEGGAGAIRLETTEKDGATFSDWYFVAEPDRIGRGDRSMQLWDEDPRTGGPPLAEVWFPAAMTEWRAGSDQAAWPPDPACDWQGPEPVTVAGREVQHLTCGSLELGLDAVTGLPLVVSWLDEDGRSTRLTATSLVLGAQPEEAFEFGPTGPDIMVLTDPEATALPDLPPVDAFELDRAAAAAIDDLPPFMALIRDSQGSQVRWYHDGQGMVRMEHFGNRSQPQPSDVWLGREGQMIRRDDDGTGQRVFVEHTDQGDPRREFAMGLGQQCEGPWEYHGPELVAGRVAHHITACTAQLWIDVETLFVLRSEGAYRMADPAEPGGVPMLSQRAVMEAIEFEVGPQPAELFDIERLTGGQPIITAAEYQCRMDPANCVTAEAPSVEVEPLPRPAATDAPAGASTDAETVVAAALVTHAGLPAQHLVVRRQTLGDQGGDGESEEDIHLDGAGHEHAALDWDLVDETNDPTIYLRTADGFFESYDDGEGGIVWREWDEQASTDPVYQRSMGIERGCPPGWEHRGFATVLDRPVHHIQCEATEFWVDVATHQVLRGERGPSPLVDDTWIEQVMLLEVGPQPPELFVLPPGAVTTTGRP
jgi:hypothetical protein